ncbi:MAG: SoxR reducing system RseC family protein [Clostridia bacterium]|nr:SoxR reducing system RseC family protein [Clostridia bacterium]
METRARVVGVDPKSGTATVESRRTSACEGCHKNTDGSGCEVCALMGSDPVLRSRADNALGARVGDTVTVTTATSRVLGYAALVFLLPLLCGAAGYLLASALTPHAALRAGAALCGFVLAFAALRIYSARVISRRCDVTITAILSSAEREADEEIK